MSLLLGKCEAIYRFQRNQLLFRIRTNIKTISTLTTHFLIIDLIFILSFYQIFDKYFTHFYIRFPHYVSSHFDCPCCEKRQRLKGNIHSRTVHEGPDAEQRCSSTFSLTPALGVDCGQRNTPAALPSPPGKETSYTQYRRLTGSKGRSKWEGNSRPTGFRSPDSSESLYHLCYPALPLLWVPWVTLFNKQKL